MLSDGPISLWTIGVTSIKIDLCLSRFARVSKHTEAKPVVLTLPTVVILHPRSVSLFHFVITTRDHHQSVCFVNLVSFFLLLSGVRTIPDFFSE